MYFIFVKTWNKRLIRTTAFYVKIYKTLVCKLGRNAAFFCRRKLWLAHYQCKTQYNACYFGKFTARKLFNYNFFLYSRQNFNFYCVIKKIQLKIFIYYLHKRRFIKSLIYIKKCDFVFLYLFHLHIYAVNQPATTITSELQFALLSTL